MKETKHKPKKSKTIIAGIVGAVTGAAIAMGVMKYMPDNTSFDRQLMEKAMEINKFLPQMVDNNTRMDFVNVMPGNKFQYNYTFVNADAGMLDTNKVKDFVKPNILSYVKTNPEMSFIKKNNTTLYYNYKDRNGNFLFILSLLPEQYNKK
jgi:hypothetical protein